MNRNPADARAFIDHQHALAQLRRLHRRAPARRAAAQDDEIIMLHRPLSPAYPKAERPIGREINAG